MLKILNDLQPFFEDCYRRINVREYGRIKNISAPTASQLLKGYMKEGLLKMEEDRGYHFFYADKESKLFIDLSRSYWRLYLERIGIIKKIEEECVNPLIILFGSLSKAEAKPDSDIDLAVFSSQNKRIDLSTFEKKREIQLFSFKRGEKASVELLNNIHNGYIIRGSF